MFRPSCQSQSPFTLRDLDMSDTKCHFAAQTSTWCGMANLSGKVFLSKVSSSTSGSSGGFRPNDPGVKKWQSLSDMQSFTPSLRSELRATRGESRQSEGAQWLQDAHERLDTQLDRLRTRDAQLSHHITAAQLLDMKHKLSESISTLQQEKKLTKLSQFEESQQRSQFHEKVQKLEKDLLQMRSTLGRASNDEPPERTSPKVNTELSKLREAEIRANTQKKEQNQVLLQLQSSTETQRTLLNQMEELNQRLSHAVQNHSAVQEQLTEANNKISQACLEKAILSTEVLKLEDNIKDLKAKLTEALSDKHNLIQEQADLHQRNQVLELQLQRTQLGSESAELQDNTKSQNKQMFLMEEESKALREVNKKLTCELEMIKQRLEMLQYQLRELTADRDKSSKQITDLEAENSQVTREKEELLKKMNEEKNEMKETCCQLRESVEALKLEKQNMQDQYLCLEDKLLEKEQKLQQQEEEYQKQDAVGVQNIEDLKAVAMHWTEKWQKVALTLQATQEELEDLKKNNYRNEESDRLLRAELDAYKQELEMERSMSHMLLNRYKDKGGEAVQTQDKETATDLSESSLLRQPASDSHSSQNKSPQVYVQNNEVQWLKKRLSEREKELREKTEALKRLESLREMEKCEAQIKVSALELKLTKKVSEDNHGDEGHANVSPTDSPRAQLEESRRRDNQLHQEKMQAVQKLQTPKDLYQIKDDRPSVESRIESNACPVSLTTDQQRRRVTEQLKDLFKDREEKDLRNNIAAATVQSEASSVQDWTPTPNVVRTAGDRWNWQQSSVLMPVFEEDEDSSELPGEEIKEPEEEADAEESLHNQKHQMSTTSAENILLKAEYNNLLQAPRFLQPIQDLHAAAEKVSHVSGVDESSDECNLQWKPYSLTPDGIFLAEPVNICSPDEDEEEGEKKFVS